MTLADTGRDGGSGIVDDYRAVHLDQPAPNAGPPGRRLPGPDEFLDPEGTVRTGWQDLAATIDLLGVEGMQARGAQVQRLLEDDGVTYGAPPNADQPAGLWQLDPLPVIIGHREWTELSHGLIQRAELLDRLQADLYGPRELLRRGLIRPS